jgi:arylsulfatase A-like enzyme
VEFIDGYDRRKPLCLFVGFGGPHPPWDPPERFAQMYDPADCAAAVPCEAEPVPEGLPERARKALQRSRVGPISEEQARKIRSLYYGKVSLIDEWFGRILDACEGRGLLEDALIIHWSDHGEMLCEHGGLGKSVFFDGALNIVMNVRWPGRIQGGKVSNALVETVDVFPTILEAVDGEHSGRCLGRSLWPCLWDPDSEVRETAFSEVYSTSMAMTQDYKYACDEAGQGYMLFDRQDDPNESRNLVGRPEMQEVEREMRDRLLRFYLSAQVKQ